VRDRIEARAIRQALATRGLRTVYLSDKDSVFESDEAAWLFYLLEACAEPERHRRLKAALATPVLDLPLTRLDQFNRDELAWEAEVERFRKYQRVWRHQGVLPMLRMLLSDFDVPARLLPLPDGERTITNLLHLSELLQTAAADLDGEHALIRWLAEQLQQSAGAADEQVLRLESDDDLVRVITIYKSKGLEYPLVFLPFICNFRKRTRKNTPVAKYHDDQGQWRTVVKPEEKDIEAMDNERLAEEVRLLYVAVTRARYACWLGVGAMGSTTKKSGEKSELHQSGLGYLLSGRRMIPTCELPEKLNNLKGECPHITLSPLPDATDVVYRPAAETTPLAPALTFAGAVARNWWISSYSGMLAGAHMAAVTPPAPGEALETPSDADGLAAPESAAEDQLQEAAAEAAATPTVMTAERSIHAFPRGPEPGTFLHGLLEWAADQGFADLARDRHRLDTRLAVYCKRRDRGEWVPVLQTWLHHLLQTPLLLPHSRGRFTMGALTRDCYQAEMEFMFAVHRLGTRMLDDTISRVVMPGALRPELKNNDLNGMVKGFIDLVFCHQGRYYVMDYKSNYLGETGRAYGARAMATAMLEHRYDLQYVLYSLALHRLLKARLTDYDYQRHMGGVLYLFLRGVDAAGQGVYGDKPPQGLIETLDDWFAGKEKTHDQ
jgi:exodeoxyribonuclease V beta subunit